MLRSPVPVSPSLVRRCAIALLAAADAEAVPLRTAQSPTFALIVDAALHGKTALPPALIASFEHRLAQVGLTRDESYQAEPIEVDVTTLRILGDSLAWAHDRSEQAARRLLRHPASGVPHDDAVATLVAAGEAGLFATIARGSVVLDAISRSALATFAERLEALAVSYRALGETAADFVLAVSRHFAMAKSAHVLEIARALDRACELLEQRWTIVALQSALVRETRTVVDSPDAEPMPGALAVVAEVPTPIPTRKRHFSASSLNMYAECARKWYFRYLCGAVRDEGSSASHYGTAFHEALEAFHGVYPRVSAANRTELERRLEGELNTAFERHRRGFEADVEFHLARRRAQRTALRYIDWLLERTAREPFSVVGCEVAADVSIEGFPFVGYIDRVDRNERSGAVTVIDYKTGSIPESAAEYRAKIAAGRDFQLPFYYWAQTAAGERVERLSLVPLKDSALDVAPVELEVVPGEPPRSRFRDSSVRGTIGVIELERAREMMKTICERVSAPDISEFAVTDDPNACRFCVYRPSCRERPADDDRRFGR